MATAWGGSAGDVSFGSYFDLNVTQWTLTETGDAMDITTFLTLQTDSHRAFIAGILEWSGSFEGYAENVTGPTDPGNALETGTARFTTGGADYFEGTIFITEAEWTTGIDAPDTVRCTFQGSGALTKMGV